MEYFSRNNSLEQNSNWIYVFYPSVQSNPKILVPRSLAGSRKTHRTYAFQHRLPGLLKQCLNQVWLLLRHLGGASTQMEITSSWKQYNKWATSQRSYSLLKETHVSLIQFEGRVHCHANSNLLVFTQSGTLMLLLEVLGDLAGRARSWQCCALDQMVLRCFGLPCLYTEKVNHVPELIEDMVTRMSLSSGS